jgi:TRAP-type C4-dicarboxylate transport system substrate-binding protein
MKKVILSILMAALVIGLIFNGCASPAPAQTIELKFSTGSPLVVGLGKQVYVPWLAKIEEQTAAIGKPVKFTTFPSEALGKFNDQYDLVVKGIADVDGPWGPQHFPGRMPLLEALQLPCLFPSSVVASQVAHELVNARPEIQKEVSEAKLLFFTTTPPAGISTRTKQVKTLDDFKGMKVSSRPGMANFIVQSLGATPVPMSPTDAYQALERGVIDGVIMNWDGTMTFKYNDVTKYRTSTPLSLWGDPLACSMNLNTWNKLPPEVQKIVDQNSGLAQSKIAGEVFDNSGSNILNLIKQVDQKAGNPDVYAIPSSEFQNWLTAVNPLYDKWIADVSAKGLPGKAVYETLRQIMSKYSK